METTIKKLQNAVKAKFEERRASGQPVDIDFLNEIMPMVEMANGLSELCKRMEGEKEEPDGTFSSLANVEISQESQNYLDDIQQKLEDCEKYLQKWIESKSEIYKNMAKSALKDSESFIGIAKQELKSQAERQKLQGLISRHNIDLAKLV